jgi:hypothetical protein
MGTSWRGLWVLIAMAACAGHGKSTPAKSAEAPAAASALPLTAALTQAQPLTRVQALRLALGSEAADPELLLRACTSDDPRKRVLAVQQLGELSAPQVDAVVVLALVSAARSADPELATQALASWLRLGRARPEALIPLLRDHGTLRELKYFSATANSDRRLQLMISDVAIAALAQYAPMPRLDLLALAYAERKRAPDAGLAAAAAPDEGEGANELPSDFGPYYASALSLLLPRGAATNLALIEQLLTSADPELRAIAYAAASAAGRSDLIEQLAGVVRDGPSERDRTEAARALAATGESGRAWLRKLGEEANPAVRAAGLGALLHDAVCGDVDMARLSSEQEPAVLEAAVHANLEGGRDRLPSCLLRYAADHRLSESLRAGVLAALRDVSCEACTTESADRTLEQLQPALEQGSAELAEAAFHLVRVLPRRSPAADAALLRAARSQLRHVREDAITQGELFCALDQVDATYSKQTRSSSHCSVARSVHSATFKRACRECWPS